MGSDLEVPADEPQTDERCRSIERGAKLVTVMPTTYSVVLQMPRGNLETIYPRALVLAAIRRSIEAERYDEAFLACRNQRVDMNILHDHDHTRFMTNVAEVVVQIRKVEHIDLFLSQLRFVPSFHENGTYSDRNRNEDVSQTMYKETLKARDAAARLSLTTDQIANKVNRICGAFLTVLEQPQFSDRHLQNIITAHVCKVPADLESGLEMVGRLQGAHDVVAALNTKLT